MNDGPNEEFHRCIKVIGHNKNNGMIRVGKLSESKIYIYSCYKMNFSCNIRYSKPERSIVIAEVLWTEGAKTNIPVIDGSIGVMYNFLLDQKMSSKRNRNFVQNRQFTEQGRF